MSIFTKILQGAEDLGKAVVGVVTLNPVSIAGGVTDFNSLVNGSPNAGLNSVLSAQQAAKQAAQNKKNALIALGFIGFILIIILHNRK